MDRVILLDREGRQTALTPIRMERRGNAAWLVGRGDDGGERACALAEITAVIDGDGEVIEPPIRYARERLGWDWPAPPGAPGEKLKEHVKRGLRVLLSIAVADGPLTEAERAILMAYVQARADQVRLPCAGADRAPIEAMIPRMRPSRQVTMEALDKQSVMDGNPYGAWQWADHLALLISHAGRLIAAGNTCPDAMRIHDDLAVSARFTNRREED